MPPRAPCHTGRQGIPMAGWGTTPMVSGPVVPDGGAVATIPATTHRRHRRGRLPAQVHPVRRAAGRAAARRGGRAGVLTAARRAADRRVPAAGHAGGDGSLPMTEREREVLTHVARGESYRRSARRCSSRRRPSRTTCATSWPSCTCRGATSSCAGPSTTASPERPRRSPLPPPCSAPHVRRSSVEKAERKRAHSHSIVPGGFDVMSYATRFTPGTSLMIRLAIDSSTS
jgi:hypothetical protein